MDSLYKRVLKRIENQYTLEPLPVPEEVEEIKLPLGVFRLNMYNWKADGIRKISVMRSSLKIPKLEVLAIEIYPELEYDVPLLAVDFSLMKKKTFIYMNFIPLFTDPAYFARYIEPLREVHEHFDTAVSARKQPKPWLLPYITDYTVYAMPKNSSMGRYKECAVQYVSRYLATLRGAQKVTNENRLQQIKEASDTYCEALSTKDGSKQMLGRIIGMKRANIIFEQVIR
jgi:hypothetical protein